MSHYAALPKAVALAIPLMFGAWAVQAADLIQTAEQGGRFNGFLHLLEAAGMVEVLEGEGPFTVFAPVDEAFGQLPPGVLEWLLAEENGNVLETIIQSHIVPGAALRAQDFLDHEVEVEAVGGAMLAVGGTAGVILVLPLEAAITEVNERTEPKSEAIPISAIVIGAPQDAFETVPIAEDHEAYELEILDGPGGSRPRRRSSSSTGSARASGWAMPTGRVRATPRPGSRAGRTGVRAWPTSRSTRSTSTPKRSSRP